MASITGGELLAKCLINEGITKVFGIPGGQLTQFIDAIVRWRGAGIEYILTRHEASCANMADAFFRVSAQWRRAREHRPGASNMVAGMEAANSDNIPLLAITPQIHTSRSYPFKGSMQQLDQITLYRPSPSGTPGQQVDRIPELVSTAMREALSERPPCPPGHPGRHNVRDARRGQRSPGPPEKSRSTGAPGRSRAYRKGRGDACQSR